MSLAMMEAVFRIGPNDLTSGHRLVLLSIADHTRDELGNCFPSINRIADRCGMSRENAKRLLRELNEHGWISRTERKTGGRKTTNEYTINAAKWITQTNNKLIDTDRGVGVVGDPYVGVVGDPYVGVVGDPSINSNKNGNNKQRRQKAAASGKSTNPEADKTAKSLYPRMCKVFSNMWERHYRAKYTWTKKDGSLMFQIWKALGQDLAECRRVFANYFAETENFYRGHSIGKLCSDLNRFKTFPTSRLSEHDRKIIGDTW